MKVDISYNDELNGIELRFSEKPSAEIINEVKRKMGFKYSRRQNLWWATRTEQREEFAKNLQAALSEGNAPESISITVEPSHEPSEENIKHRKFSYVTIYYKDVNGEGMTDKYVLFEPSKNLAIDIATQFGKNTYGDDFQKVYVYPRNYVREAKKLLAAGKVIQGTGNKPAPKQKPEPKKEAPKKSGKFRVEKILLTTEATGHDADFSNAKELHSWEAANKDVKSLVGQVSDVYYKITWEDGEVREGSVDLEPRSDYKNKKEILSNWIFNFLTNLSKAKPEDIKGLYGPDAIDYAKRMITNYHFWDFSTEVEEGITWVVYNSKDKIDSLQISEQEAVNYINRRPEFGRDKMRYERMTTKKAHTLWDKQKEEAEKETDDTPVEPANKHTPTPDDGDTWVVFDSNGKVDSLQISQEAAQKYIGRRPAFSQDKMSYEQMTTKKAYQLYDELQARKALEPGQLTIKHKLEILSEFKRSLDNQKLDLSGDELRSQFGDWFRIGYSNIASEEDNVWQEYEMVKSITNPNPNEKQIPEKDYRLFFIRFTEYAEKEIENEEDRITLKAFTDWLEKNYANINNADKEGLKKYYADFIKTLEKNRKKIENLSKPKRAQPFSGNYNKLLKLIPDLLEKLESGYTHGVSSFGKDSALMDLNLDVLYKDSKGAYIIALSHYYRQNGDSIADPDMQIRVDPTLEMVEALTYQDSLGFQKVYQEEDGKMMVAPKLKKELNKFLRQWLINLTNQEHQIVWSEDGKEEPEDSTVTESENYSAIGRTNEDTYKFIEDFSGGVIYQMAVQGDMTVSEAQVLITESASLSKFIKDQFAKLENPTPVDAKNVAIEALKKAGSNKSEPAKKKSKNQHELNQEIEQFLADKDSKKETYSSEDKAYISQYSGSGGLAKKGAAGKGLLYEYYTPDEIVKKMWGLAKKFGYTDGAVLEPSCGTGNFLQYVPANARAVGYETNPTAKRIAEILHPRATIYQAAFESQFFKGNVHLKDDFNKSQLFDLVIGNPPYGEFSGKYAGMGEKKWTKATRYEEYFITRGLDLLKPGGLLIYIIPSSFLNSGRNKVKEAIAEKAEPLTDGYWLPERLFSTTDIETGIVVFKKRT